MKNVKGYLAKKGLLMAMKVWNKKRLLISYFF